MIELDIAMLPSGHIVKGQIIRDIEGQPAYFQENAGLKIPVRQLKIVRDNASEV